MSVEEPTFTEAELRATEEAGHRAWHDGFCQCWPDAGFSGEAYLYDLDHILAMARRLRGEAVDPVLPHLE